MQQGFRVKMIFTWKKKNRRFGEDIRVWPAIEYRHIFAYFVESQSQGTFIREQLLSRKQMEAYNYFQSGFVRIVYSMMFSKGATKCVLLKAKVNPSQELLMKRMRRGFLILSFLMPFSVSFQKNRRFLEV